MMLRRSVRVVTAEARSDRVTVKESDMAGMMSSDDIKRGAR